MTTASPILILDWQRALLSAPLTAAERMIAVALSLRINSKTGTAWPSLDRLAADTCQSLSVAKRAIRRLRKLGLLIVERVKGRANRYRLAFAGQPTRGSTTTDTPASSDPPTPASRDPLKGEVERAKTPQTPASGGEAIFEDITVEAPTDITVEAPTDITVEAPADITVEVPADITVDDPILDDAPADITVEVPAPIAETLSQPHTAASESIPAADTGKTLDELVEAVIDDLNAKTGAQFTHQHNATRRLVSRRIKRYGIDPVKATIADCCSSWGADPKLARYLTPQTILKPSRIEATIAAPPAPKAPRAACHKPFEPESPLVKSSLESARRGLAAMRAALKGQPKRAESL